MAHPSPIWCVFCRLRGALFYGCAHGLLGELLNATQHASGVTMC